MLLDGSSVVRRTTTSSNRRKNDKADRTTTVVDGTASKKTTLTSSAGERSSIHAGSSRRRPTRQLFHPAPSVLLLVRFCILILGTSSCADIGATAFQAGVVVGRTSDPFLTRSRRTFTKGTLRPLDTTCVIGRSETLVTTNMAESSSSAKTATTTSEAPPSKRGGVVLPTLPLPPMITSSTPGTWAYDTMSRRVDSEILQRTQEENINSELFQHPDVQSKFQALRKELQSASDTKLTHLDVPTFADVTEAQKVEAQHWHDILSPYVEAGNTYLTAPWLVTEFYVYRRLMQCLDYFNPASLTYLFDPFETQKRAGLKTSVDSAEAVLKRMGVVVESMEESGGKKWEQGMELAVELALWGNKMDLSLWPADVGGGGAGDDDTDEKKEDAFAKVLQSATENLLHDDTPQLLDLCRQLHAKGGGHVDIIVDNAGFELVTDLILGDYLLQSGIAKTVTFQLKSHPTFVSDALEKDLVETAEHYASLDGSKYPSASRAGKRWMGYLTNARWICHEDEFWVQPLAMWEIYDELRTDMSSRCDLAFVKGDANYRRLLGDRTWEYTSPFQDVVGCYFPCPVCALRTLKAELGCGMDATQVERARGLDENWLVNGRFGVVHFGTGAVLLRWGSM